MKMAAPFTLLWPPLAVVWWIRIPATTNSVRSLVPILDAHFCWGFARNDACLIFGWLHVYFQIFRCNCHDGDSACIVWRDFWVRDERRRVLHQKWGRSDEIIRNPVEFFTPPLGSIHGYGRSVLDSPKSQLSKNFRRCLVHPLSCALGGTTGFRYINFETNRGFERP